MVISVILSLEVPDADAAGNLEVSIWLADENGYPAEKQGDLTVPDSLSTGTALVAFTAPASGIHLEPETTYVVVLNVVEEGTATGVNTGATQSGSETGQTGWSIANFRISDNSGNGSWAFQSGWPLKIGVTGRALRVWEQAGVPKEHFAQQGQNAWREPGAACRTRTPYMSLDDVKAGFRWYCDTRTGVWVKANPPRPCRDYDPAPGFRCPS